MADVLLKEDGDRLLQEDGTRIPLAQGPLTGRDSSPRYLARSSMVVAGLTIALSLLQSTLAPAVAASSTARVSPTPLSSVRAPIPPVSGPSLLLTTLASVAPGDPSPGRPSLTTLHLRLALVPPVGDGSRLLTTLAGEAPPAPPEPSRLSTTLIPRIRAPIPPGVGVSDATPLVLHTDRPDIFGSWLLPPPRAAASRVPDVGFRSAVLDLTPPAAVAVPVSIISSTVLHQTRRPGWFYTLTSAQLEDTAVPVVTQRWPQPQPTARLRTLTTWTHATPRPLLAPVVADDPVKPRLWPLPLPTPAPLTRLTWTQGTSPFLHRPFGQTAWPLPLAKVAPAVGATERRFLGLIEPLALTPQFGKAEWPLPPQVKPAPHFAFTRLKIPDPGALPDGHAAPWPVPPLPARVTLTWTHNKPTYYVDAVPPKPIAWPLPVRSVVAPPTWTQNLLQSTLRPADPPPGRTTDWAIVRAVVVPVERRTGSLSRFPGLIEPLALTPRFGKAEWPLPRPKWVAPPIWTGNLLESTLAPAPIAPATPDVIVDVRPTVGDIEPRAVVGYIDIRAIPGIIDVEP